MDRRSATEPAPARCAHLPTKIAVVAVLIAAILTSCSTDGGEVGRATEPAEHVAVADKFVLIGADGKPRCNISMDETGHHVVVFLFGSDPRVPNIGLIVAPDGGASVNFWTSEGRLSAAFSTDVLGCSTLELLAPKGSNAVRLTSGFDGTAALSFHDSKGVRRGWIGIDKSGAPSITLSDAAGATVFHAP